MKPTRVFIIAEVGVNHNGSVAIAKKLIDAAKKVGADAVKFQTFRAKDLVTKGTPKAAYQKSDRVSGSTQLKMLERLELSDSDQKKLFDYAARRSIEFLSTPFDVRSLDFLEHLGVKKIKLSSGDMTNGPLLLAAARTGLPVILSTGMATLAEVEDAVAVLAFGYGRSRSEVPKTDKVRHFYRRAEARALVARYVSLLQCTTEYPAPVHDVNLRAMDVLRDRFKCRVGLSDHSEGILAPIAATGREACLIEKHLTLDKTMPGPDHRASLEPEEFALMVRGIRIVEKMLGDGNKKPRWSEVKNISRARKVLVAARSICRGQLYAPDDLTAKRAGAGLSPMLFWSLLGKRAKRSYKKDERITR